ncbi:MAG TPA: enolase C-terminal domain-like protein [Planctomycetota bacterium]|nr:enolase C-terminal domain-like protein [Planctomycetota bacterium]
MSSEKQIAIHSNKQTDVRCVGAELYFIPVRARLPLKFGHEVTTSVTCARVKLTVADRAGKIAHGWGETPMSVQWVWPCALPYEERHQALLRFCKTLAREWSAFNDYGHPIEVGYRFQRARLIELLRAENARRDDAHKMPWLAALVCCSLFDIALHDAYGNLHNIPIYETYNAQFMNQDLSAFLCAADDSRYDFSGKYPRDFLAQKRPESLPAWHLVGGLDPLTQSDLTSAPLNDGFPEILTDWIRADELKCLKIKLKGNDIAWDLQRIVRVGKIAIDNGVDWLSTDFNCTVHDVAYVNEILDLLLADHPRIYGMILYVEQPFPYELEQHRIDVRSVSARKPLFMDESAHDWQMVKLGRELGWSGVALKTCKTQTGAILSACWARAHGMTLMVQDLTNPMLAMIPHALLAAHTGTIMGIETNACQFYPRASEAEATVHPVLYKRSGGRIDLATIRGAGFGYRLLEIKRELGEPV